MRLHLGSGWAYLGHRNPAAPVGSLLPFSWHPRASSPQGSTPSDCLYALSVWCRRKLYKGLFLDPCNPRPGVGVKSMSPCWATGPGHIETRVETGLSLLLRQCPGLPCLPVLVWPRQATLGHGGQTQ